MGPSDRTWIDVAAVRAVASRFDDAAEAIDAAARTHLASLTFDGATAGKAHITQGNALHTALNQLTEALSQWSRASLEIATALRAGAGRYADADQRGAVRIG
jgi:uncharacterized protein YukE